MPNQTLYDNFSQVRQYIDQEKPDLSSYVTKTELSGCSYATTSELNSYLPLSGGTLGGNLIPSQSASYNLGSSSSRWKEVRSKFVYADTAYLQDTSYSSSIIPKENNTYTLGDSSHIYSNTYSYNYRFGYVTYISSDNDYDIHLSVNGRNKVQWNLYQYIFIDDNYRAQSSLGANGRPWGATYTNDLYLGSQHIRQDEYSIGFQINGNNTMRMFVGSFRPWTDKGATLGSSTTKWSTTYTSNIYADTAYISDYHNLMWTGTAAEYSTLADYTTYNLYLIQSE